jgi:hypothetical protein
MKTAHKIGLARAAYRAIHFGRTIIGQSDRCVVTRAGLNYDLDLSQGIDFAIYLGIFARLKRTMANPVIIDLRNIYRPEEVTSQGFRYESVGRISQKAPISGPTGNPAG